MKQKKIWAWALSAILIAAMTGCQTTETENSESTTAETTAVIETEIFQEDSEASVTTSAGDFSLDDTVTAELFLETIPTEAETETVAATTATATVETTAVTEAATKATSESSSSGSALSRTAGIWKTSDTAEVAALEMDGTGAFNAYAMDGSILYQGSVQTVDEYGDGTYRYDLYDDGTYVMGFYFDSDTQIHIGNAGTVTYTKQ